MIHILTHWKNMCMCFKDSIEQKIIRYPQCYHGVLSVVSFVIVYKQAPPHHAPMVSREATMCGQCLLTASVRYSRCDVSSHFLRYFTAVHILSLLKAWNKNVVLHPRSSQIWGVFTTKAASSSRNHTSPDELALSRRENHPLFFVWHS